jgi:hypothetical protein
MTVLDIGKGRIDASIRWKGIDKVLKGINKASEKVEIVTLRGLLEAGLMVKGEAQKITPVQTGNLKASAYVIWGGGSNAFGNPNRNTSKIKYRSNPTAKNKKVKAGEENVVREHAAVLNHRMKSSLEPFTEVGYTANYAAKVHERTGVSHAKFLEQAFQQNSRRIIAILKKHAKLRGGKV